MRSAFLLAGCLFFASSRLAAAPCTPSSSTLCLNASRFEVNISWRDSRGRTGVGHAVPITADTGYFWFFSEANIELVVKVLDARALSGKYWVFFGALTSVEFDLTVTDTSNGRSKTYHNPLGQFASVGDTSAFEDVVGGQPLHTTMVASGVMASDAVQEDSQRLIDSLPHISSAALEPCIAPSSRLGLTRCRFLLHVDWRDSRGRQGRGQAVQLTQDTGYFWFFSPSNVELMVKVLDARAVSGKFWVFFGALSNVEYELTVTDVLTGVVKQYTNAAGVFASVGDTAAFAGGESVTPRTEDTRAVTADIDPEGGTVVATASDGSLFTLEIPPDALSSATRITVTPLGGIDKFPFTGGMTAGVQLEPEGLFLWKPAVLTIQAATAPPDPAARVAFGYRGRGENFLVLPFLSDAGGVRLSVSHFSGYGEGVAVTPEDLEGLTFCEVAERQLAARPPDTGHFASYLRQTAIVLLARACEDVSDEERDARLKAIWQAAWDVVVWPALDALKDECNPKAFEPVFQLAFEYLNYAAAWIADPAFSELKRTIVFETVKSILLKCIDAAYEHCKSRHEPGQAFTILKVLRFLQKAQLIDDADNEKILEKLRGCLTFEMTFDSTVTVGSSFSGKSAVSQFHLKAVVPVELELAEDYYLAGEGSLKYQSLSGTYSDARCSMTFDSIGGVFRVEKMVLEDLAMNLDGQSQGPFVYRAPTLYTPGNPMEQMTLACPGGRQTLPFESLFVNSYLSLHVDETAYGPGDSPYFSVRRWEPVLSGDVVARKDYERSIRPGPFAELAEQTSMVLKHTPR